MNDPFPEVGVSIPMAAPRGECKVQLGLALLAPCVLRIGAANADDSVAAGRLVVRPGTAAFADHQHAEHFGNTAIEMKRKVDHRHPTGMTLIDHVHECARRKPAPLALILSDGRTFKPSDMRLLSSLGQQTLPDAAKAARLTA